jgi:hypothetical protein
MPSLPTPKVITLQVGERKFETLEATLNDSAFLSSMLQHGSPQADGSYFLDSDLKLFEPILQFLRRGTYPLF